MKVLLDTSAFFALEDVPMGLEAYTTPSVLEELAKYGDKRAEYLEHKVKVISPAPASIESMATAARQTGDISRLSPTDLELLALARELGAEIWTDDYSIQNLAKHMGIPYRTMGTKGITRVVKWKYRCVGCGKTFSEEVPDCPICGSQVGTSRKKKGK
jgi:UPF0271 protein